MTNQITVTQLLPLLGQTLTSVTGGKGVEEMRMTLEDGRVFRFYHYQQCCESVDIEDVCGDLSDLVGAPLLVAEQTTKSDEEAKGGAGDWTFYKFSTIKGSVTVRWFGEWNYYSTEVTFEEVKPEAQTYTNM